MKYFYLFLVLALFSCKGVKVINTKYIKKIPKNYLTYSLPTNIIHIDVEVTETKNLSGPYHDFAEKLLGIKNVIKSDFDEYIISDINVNTISRPDTNNTFFVTSHCYNKLNYINTNEQNILSGINNLDNSNLNGTINNKYFTNNLPDSNAKFYELTQKDIINTKTDTVWKQVKIDTNFTKIPVQRKTTDTLTFDELAQNAAHHVLRIRKRLFKLLSGAYKNTPNISSINEVIAELKNEEKQYLELFIGKSFSSQKHYHFYFTPSLSDIDKKIEIAMFNKSAGFTSLENNNNIPIYIEINNTNSTKHLNDAFLKLKKARKNKSIIYRIPENIIVNFIYGDELLYEKQIQISQLGILSNLPKTYLSKKYSIKFNQETGNINSVILNKN